MKVNWDFWLHTAAWTDEQFILLSVGVDPDVRLKELKEIWEENWDGTQSLLIKDSEKSRYRLIKSNRGFSTYPSWFKFDDRYIKLEAAVAWALEKNWDLPQEILDRYDSKLNSKKAPDYSTKWIEIQNAAINQFFNPRHELDAKREEVIAWIEAKAKDAKIQNPSSIASAIFTIIKPEDHDPKNKRVTPQQA
jgi:hypothetical protein